MGNEVNETEVVKPPKAGDQVDHVETGGDQDTGTDKARAEALTPGDADRMAGSITEGSGDKLVPAVELGAEGDEAKPLTEEERNEAALKKLKEEGQGPADMPGVEDVVTLRTGVKVNEPRDAAEGDAEPPKPPDASDDEGDAKKDTPPETAEIDPKVAAEMEAVKAHLEALFTNNDPQKQLLAVDSLAADGVTSFQLQDGGNSHNFTLQKSEIAGNRGVSNPKYANMTHFYVDGKVALRGNLLTNPGDGPKFDQQRHYKTGQLVDFAGTKGGPVMEGIKGELEGAKVLIERNGVKMEATAVKGDDGQITFEMKEVKPPPKEVDPQTAQAERLKEFDLHPEKFLPQLSGSDMEARLGVMKTMSDMDIQNLKVETRDGQTFNLNSTFIEGKDGAPPQMILKMNDKVALHATFAESGIKMQGDQATYDQLNSIDWRGAKVTIDYANESTEDKTFTMPEVLGGKTETVQLEGEEARKMMLGKVPDGDLERVAEHKDNARAMAGFVEGSTGFKFPQSENMQQVYDYMKSNPDAFTIVGQGNDLKPRSGDIILVKPKEGVEGLPSGTDAMVGILDGKGRIVIPEGDGTQFKTVGDVSNVSSNYDFQLYRPKSLPVERAVEEESPPKAEPETSVDVGKAVAGLAGREAYRETPPWKSSEAAVNFGEGKIPENKAGTLAVGSVLKDAGLDITPDARASELDKSMAALAEQGRFEPRQIITDPAQLKDLPPGSVVIARTQDDASALKWSQDGDKGYRSHSAIKGEGDAFFHIDDDAKWKAETQADAISSETYKEFVVYKPKVQEAPPAREEEASGKVIDDVASMLKTPEFGNPKAFEWLDPDASMADIEKGMLERSDKFESTQIAAGDLDPAKGNLRNGDIVAAGEPGEGKFAVYQQNEYFKEGRFIIPSGDAANPFKQFSTVDGTGLKPDADGNFRVYRAKEAPEEKPAEADGDDKTGDTSERGNFDDLTAAEVAERIRGAHEKFVEANKNRNFSSLDSFNAVLKDATGNADLPDFKDVAELEAKLPELGFKPITENAQVGDLVIMKPKTEGVGRPEVGYISERNGTIRFGNQEARYNDLIKTHDISVYRAGKDVAEARPEEAKPEESASATWSDRAKALGSVDYLGEGNNPWADAPVNPLDREFSTATREAMFTTWAISKELDSVNPDHFNPTMTAGALRGKLAVPQSGFERLPLAANTDPSTLKEGDIIFGMNQTDDGKNERYFGVVGSDGKVYSTSLGEDNRISWQGRELSSFEGFKQLERYSSKASASDAAPENSEIKGPENPTEAMESATAARDMLTPLFDTQAQSLIGDADVDAIRRMGVTEITVTKGDKSHVLKFGEVNGQPSLSVDDKVLLQEGRMDGRYVNNYKFTDLAGATFEVKFINGNPITVKLPDDYGKDRAPTKG